MEVYVDKCPKLFSSFFSCPDTISGQCLYDYSLQRCIDTCSADDYCHMGIHINDRVHKNWCLLFPTSHISATHEPDTFLETCAKKGYTFVKNNHETNRVYSDTPLYLCLKDNKGMLTHDFGFTANTSDAVGVLFRPVFVHEPDKTMIWNDNAIFILDREQNQRLVFDRGAGVLIWDKNVSASLEESNLRHEKTLLSTVFFIKIEPSDNPLSEMSTIRLFATNKDVTDDLSGLILYPILLTPASVLRVGASEASVSDFRISLVHDKKPIVSPPPSFWDRSPVFRYVDFDTKPVRRIGLPFYLLVCVIGALLVIGLFFW